MSRVEFSGIANSGIGLQPYPSDGIKTVFDVLTLKMSILRLFSRFFVNNNAVSEHVRHLCRQGC